MLCVSCGEWRPGGERRPGAGGVVRSRIPAEVIDEEERISLLRCQIPPSMNHYLNHINNHHFFLYH